MNAPVNISYEDRLKARYAAARSRIFAAGKKQANDNERVQKPLWAREKITFEAHVNDYRRAMISYVSPKKAFVIERARDFGFTLAELTAKSRRTDLVYARQMIMLEVKEKWPEISLPELGRLFGGFDHTTILHALRRAEDYRSGKTQPHVVTKRVKSKGVYGAHKRIKPEVQNKMVVMFLEWGMTRTEIAEEIGVAYKTVINVLRRKGAI